MLFKMWLNLILLSNFIDFAETLSASEVFSSYSSLRITKLDSCRIYSDLFREHFHSDLFQKKEMRAPANFKKYDL